MKKFEVLHHHESRGYFECRPRGGGYIVWLDLLISGDFPPGTDPESLVGCVVECEQVVPLIGATCGGRVVMDHARARPVGL